MDWEYPRFRIVVFHLNAIGRFPGQHLDLVGDAGMEGGESFALSRHGTATVALNICEVTEAVDFGELLARHRDVAWTVSLTCQGLDHIAAATGWSDESLRSWTASIATAQPPCAHRFGKLHRSYRKTSCDCWFEADVDHSAVKVRFTLPDGTVQETTVREMSGPLFIEDDFPVAKARLDAGAYLLLDREGRELSRVTIPG